MEKRSQPRTSSVSSEESLLAFSTTFFPHITTPLEESLPSKTKVPPQPVKPEKSETLFSEPGWIPLTPQSGLELRSWDESWWNRYSRGISTVAFWVFAVGMLGYGIFVLLSMRGSGNGGDWVFRGKVEGLGGGGVPSSTGVEVTTTGAAARATGAGSYVERRI